MFFLANGQGQTLEFGNSAASMGGEDVLGNCRVSTTRTQIPKEIYTENDINGSFCRWMCFRWGDVFFAKKNGTQIVIVQSAKVPMAVHCMAF